MTKPTFTAREVGEFLYDLAPPAGTKAPSKRAVQSVMWSPITAFYISDGRQGYSDVYTVVRQLRTERRNEVLTAVVVDVAPNRKGKGWASFRVEAGPDWRARLILAIQAAVAPAQELFKMRDTSSRNADLRRNNHNEYAEKLTALSAEIFEGRLHHHQVIMDGDTQRAWGVSKKIRIKASTPEEAVSKYKAILEIANRDDAKPSRQPSLS